MFYFNNNNSNCNHKILVALHIHPEGEINLLSVRTKCSTYPTGLIFTSRLPIGIATESDEEALKIFKLGVKTGKDNNFTLIYYGEPNEG